MIPGSNLLNQAFSLIAQQPVTYYAAQPRTVNTIGMLQPAYAAGVATTGSVQPVPRSMYERLGLDWAKNYVTVYVPQSVVSVGRNTSGDYIVFNNNRYNIEAQTAWQPIDGWSAFIAVQQQNQPVT